MVIVAESRVRSAIQCPEHLRYRPAEKRRRDFRDSCQYTVMAISRAGGAVDRATPPRQARGVRDQLVGYERLRSPAFVTEYNQGGSIPRSSSMRSQDRMRVRSWFHTLSSPADVKTRTRSGLEAKAAFSDGLLRIFLSLKTTTQSCSAALVIQTESGSPGLIGLRG